MEEKLEKASTLMEENEMEERNIIYSEKDGIATIKLNNPPLNILNLRMLNALYKTISNIEKNDEIRVVIIEGLEKAFSAGADLKEFSKADVRKAKKISEIGHKIMNLIEESGKIYIAKVKGYALGGGFELALACDIIIASNNATFGSPEPTLGLIPGWGATQRLPRIIGLKKANEILLTGRRINAEEALKLGIINTITTDETLDEETIRMAESLVKNAPLALKEIKKLIKLAFETPLKMGCQIEIEKFSNLFATEDLKEGIKAFLEKRKPQYKGR